MPIAQTVFLDGSVEALAVVLSATTEDCLQHLQGGLTFLFVESDAELKHSVGCPFVAKPVLNGCSQHGHLR